MLFILAVLIGGIAGVLLSGSVFNLFQIRIQHIWMVILAFMMQFIFRTLYINGFYGTIHSLSTGIMAGSFLMILLFFWMNRQLTGSILLAMGTLCNAVVIVANGGKMPISYDAMIETGIATSIDYTFLEAKHLVIGPNTKLTFLADIIVLPPFLGLWMEIVSIGDIILVVGVMVIVFQMVRGKWIEKVKK